METTPLTEGEQMRRLRVNLIGQKFGRLKVSKYMGRNKRKNSQWLCMCDCGKHKIADGSDLQSGNTKSCGCLSKEKVIERNISRTQHGHNKKNKISKTYQSWADMIQRCRNTHNRNYINYGGRGLNVCQRWRKFENFLEDMGERPQGQQIDRINNNGNYCKSNCRWATRKQQQRNTRRNRTITYTGKTQCISAWAEKFNIRPDVLRQRIKLGWSIERALTEPLRKQRRKA